MLKYLTIFSVLISAQLCFSQDLIQLKDGSKIEAKIVEITSTSIRYYKFTQLEGPIRIVEKYEVSEIVYQNGETEKFNVDTPQTLPSQVGTENLMRPPKPVKDPILQRGFFIEGLFGYSQYSRLQTNYYLSYQEGLEPTFLTRTDSYFTIGMRVGNKWYFGKNEKWRPGFQATWLRLGIHLGNGAEDLLFGPRTVSLANVGMCNVIKFTDRIAMEANFSLGPSMNLDFFDGYFAQGIAYSIESKFRFNSFSVGVDYQYSNMQNEFNNSRSVEWHALTLSVGRKF